MPPKFTVNNTMPCPHPDNPDYFRQIKIYEGEEEPRIDWGEGIEDEESMQESDFDNHTEQGI